MPEKLNLMVQLHLCSQKLALYNIRNPNGSSYFDKTYPQNTPAVPPLKGYLIKAKQSRNVKGGAYGTNGFNQTLGVLEKDEYAIIDGVIRSGTAYWVKIKY